MKTIEISEGIKQIPIIKNLGIKKQLLLIERYNKFIEKVDQKVVMDEEKKRWEEFKESLEILFMTISLRHVIVEKALVKKKQIDDKVQLNYINENILNEDLSKRLLEGVSKNEETLNRLEKEFEEFN